MGTLTHELGQVLDNGDELRVVPAPWSPLDFAVLHDDVGAIDERDPFAMLRRTSSPVSWHAPPRHNGSELTPIVWRSTRGLPERAGR